MTIHLSTTDQIDGAEVSASWNSDADKVEFNFARPGSFTPESWEDFSDSVIDYLHAFDGLTEVVKQVTSDEDVAPCRNGSGPDFESGGGGSTPSGAANFPSVHDMVFEFMKGANQLPERLYPHLPSVAIMDLRRDLILEEWREFLEGRHDIVKTADALADMVYVIYGTAIAYGFNLDDVVREVHRSNMTKIADGIFAENGKLLKGPSYDPPDIAEAVYGPAAELLI